jgi:uncharacterized protein (UPF0333 family)
MNRRGQFSIIAALLVAVVLIAAIMTTYSAIRYSPLQDQPQVMSAIDEINLALKQVLGFTVGYYGSVLQVTGNVSYAKMLASNYLLSGLENIADIRPEWSPSFTVKTLDLRTDWFSNNSYSSGTVSIKYDLTGIGIYNMTYSTSSRLDVQILESPSSSQVCLSITKDEDEPLNNLGRQNLKFYRYIFSNSTWELATSSSDPTTYANGTYIIDVPSGVDTDSYFMKIEDTRGIIVVASSFSRYSSTLSWSSSSVDQGFYYVDSNNTVVGTQGNFTAQRYGPDGIYDMLREAASGTVQSSSYPSYWNALGSTTLAGGTIGNLQSNDGVYMSFHSYASINGSQSTFGDTTQSGSSYTNTENTIVGSRFTITQDGWADSIKAYVNMTSSAKNMECIIYRHNDSSLVGTTQQVNVPVGTGWVTFNFAQPKPLLSANTEYVLVAWSASGYGSANLYYESGSSNQGHTQNSNYGTPPNPASFSHNNNQYAIYCTYTPPTEFTSAVEFTGQSSTATPWNDLIWAMDSSATTSGVGVTFQLYNFQTGQYPTSGDGYMTDTIGTTDRLNTQTIAINPTNFRNSTGYWKLKFTAVKSTTTRFDMKIDLASYTPEIPNYALNIQEQWTNVNATNPRQDLCIKTGALGSESLAVDVQTGGSWTPLITSLQPNTWNNVSMNSYITSATLTIRFRGGTDTGDPVQDSWNIDAVFLKNQPDISFLLSLQDSTTVVEYLQNGTMRWLGQNLQNTTQAMPIPPVSVKAIHVNQTINGVNQEVPFQIEDWASDYRVPQGLTNNATVFGDRQMLVFLINIKVSKITVWWNGSDAATQTPLAYTNRYFSDNPSAGTLSNGNLTLQFGSFNVKSTVVGGTGTSSTAYFMRINTENSTYGAGLAYVIYNGPVRDIVQQEAEWGTNNPPADNGGAHNCPNIYANIVITLPANVTYFTYQLRLMFLNSTQPRSLTDLCPIQLTCSAGQPQTENGTNSGYPIITNGTGTFYNYTSGSWTAHHWSQFISGTTKGAGIMFTDNANQQLYAFDPKATAATGSLNVSTAARTIELSPVTQSLGQVSSFLNPYDITWCGAVATFETTPIYGTQGSTPTGLWLLVEYLPSVTVIAES